MTQHGQPERNTQGGRRHSPLLLSKHGLVVTELARALLDGERGDALPRVQEYAQLLNASPGTVQSALQYLQATGAGRLQPRGRLGTFVIDLNYPLLWALARQRPLAGALPLPYSRRFEGLATGIRAQFARRALDLDFRFLRGAAARLQALSNGECDWALLSGFAVDTAAAHGFAVDVVAELEAGTYMSEPRLLLANAARALVDGMRVGMDPKSADHTYLVRAVSRGKRIRFVDVDYSQALRLLLAGDIDATVWSGEEIPPERNGLAAIPLDAQLEPVVERLGRAAVVVAQGNRAAAHVLHAVLDLPELHAIQQDVITYARVPAY